MSLMFEKFKIEFRIEVQTVETQFCIKICYKTLKELL